MLRSMTGFGKGSATVGDAEIVVSLRSVNNRNLDIHLRSEAELGPVESQVRKRLSQGFSRGRIDAAIAWSTPRGGKFEMNRALVEQYLEAFSSLKQQFSLSGDVTLELIARLPGIFQADDGISTEGEEFTSAILFAMDRAIEALAQTREEEGRHLETEMRRLCGLISTALSAIERELPQLTEMYRQRLDRRIKEILGNGHEIDQGRLAQEVVYLSERSDITEEVSRLKIHLDQFLKLLSSDQELGKRMDFLLQEMNREANTILSKSGEIAIDEAAITIKTSVEKLREQAQNVE